MPFIIHQPEVEQPFLEHRFRPRVKVLKRRAIPTVLISRDAYARMWCYVDIADKEVGWLGTVKRLENGDFLIEDLFLLKQKVSSTQTKLTVEGLNDLACELLCKGERGEEQWNNTRFWGHSHVRMPTGPSLKDDNTMDKFQDVHPWFIRGIFNKFGRAEFTIYLYEEGLKIEDAPWTFHDPDAKPVVEKEQLVVEAPLPEPKAPLNQELQDLIAAVPRDRTLRSLLAERKKIHYVPDPALRQEIEAEFAKKVTNEVFLSWLRADAEEDSGDVYSLEWHHLRQYYDEDEIELLYPEAYARRFAQDTPPPEEDKSHLQGLSEMSDEPPISRPGRFQRNVWESRYFDGDGGEMGFPRWLVENPWQQFLRWLKLRK